MRSIAAHVTVCEAHLIETEMIETELLEIEERSQCQICVLLMAVSCHNLGGERGSPAPWSVPEHSYSVLWGQRRPGLTEFRFMSRQAKMSKPVLPLTS